MKITEIDPHLAVLTVQDSPDTVWYDVRQEPFSLYGFYEPIMSAVFRRIPEDVAQKVSPGVAQLARNTAGGRVRFSTDSAFILLDADMPSLCRFSHMPLTGSAGFDLYMDDEEKHEYIGTFLPPYEAEKGFSTRLDIDTARFGSGIHSFTINFPLYSDVNALRIGLQSGSALAEGQSYAPIAPFVYYGSSITQGGCASRPGNCYQNHLCRRFNTDYLNFGFSGNARGEAAMAEYLAGLNMSLFVCDYDHNEPTAQELEQKHFSLYRTIRDRQPEVPYLMVSRPDVHGHERECSERREVIRRSYEKAKALGDQNVWFLDGALLLAGPDAGECTVDTVHPTDLGFWRMARVLGDAIERILSQG